MFEMQNFIHKVWQAADDFMLATSQTVILWKYVALISVHEPHKSPETSRNLWDQDLIQYVHDQF